MIELNSFKKIYSDFETDITLSVKEGGVTGIVGRNGAGKSTTIKAILGLIETDGGDVKIFGKTPKKLTAKDKMKIGVTMPDSFFTTELNIKDIADIMAAGYEGFDKAKFLEKCKKNNLPFDKKVAQFSTGMTAKLKMLMALSHNADLLILDEPTSGLDVVARGEMLDEIRDYLAQKPDRAVLISSHISSDLEDFCDDIYMIHNGKVIIHEDTDKLKGEYGVLKLSDEMYDKIDKQYILKKKKENFGWSCFTNERKYYAENYPDIIIEKGSIDDMIILMSEAK